MEKLEIERWLKIQLITDNFESVRLKSMHSLRFFSVMR
jgi:hypothetical protein